MIPTIKMPNGRRQAFIGGFLGILLCTPRGADSLPQENSSLADAHTYARVVQARALGLDIDVSAVVGFSGPLAPARPSRVGLFAFCGRAAAVHSTFGRPAVDAATRTDG